MMLFDFLDPFWVLEKAEIESSIGFRELFFKTTNYERKCSIDILWEDVRNTIINDDLFILVLHTKIAL